MNSRLLVALGRGGRRYNYLVGPFRFGTDMAAPLPSPYTESGAKGSLIIVDTENKLSISGGKLVCAGGKATPASGDPGAIGDGTPRSVGKAVLVNFAHTETNKFTRIGWHTGTGTAKALAHCFEFESTGNIRAVENSAFLPTWMPFTGGTEYLLLIALRSTGAFYLAKISRWWTLLWVGKGGNAATVYPGVSGYNAAFTADDLRAVDLSLYDSRFASDYGLATSRLVNPSAGATATHEANCLVDFTFTYNGGWLDVRYRYSDDSNWWALVAEQTTGNLLLIEKTAGAQNNRVVSAAAFVSGNSYRVLITADGSVHSVYVNNLSKGTYTSSNQATNTTGKVVLASGGISELVYWPRTISLPAGV